MPTQHAKDMVDILSSAWMGVGLIGTTIGLVIAWVATREMRKRTRFAQEQTISVYKQNIEAKDALAQTLAQSTAKQLELLTTERKESDARHEATIAEYRTNLHTVRNELQASTVTLGEYKERLADLNARTDFKPVLEFQREWRKENDAISSKLLETLQVLTPVLHEAVEVLKRYKPVHE